LGFMSRIGVAVVGCGAWGFHHARVYKELPRSDLIWVSDIDAHRCRAVGERYKAKQTTDFLKVLDDPDVDVVSICTPTVTHADLALAAISSGKHVLVEKPMTDTVYEAEKLISAAARHGVCLSVGFVERFNPAVSGTLKLIEEGEIGQLLMVHTRRVTRRPQRVGDVGVVKDLAIHDIDVTRFLLGEEPKLVFSSTGSLLHSFEDYTNITLCYGDGRNAFIEANWLTPKKVRTLTVTGSEGIIHVEYINQELILEKNEYIHQPLKEYAEPLYLELESFTDSVMSGKEPMVTGRDGLEALKVCEAALESARRKQAVQFGGSIR
jgi:UDP-N-acetylglucosamine 3-dehydrogenase